MDIFGIDFTSKPSRRKPITCLHCTLDSGVLRYRSLEEWTTFGEFETALERPGPWIGGFDFPFGQSRRFIETIGWPLSWAAYVELAGKLGRSGFREVLTSYRERRPFGDKEHRRTTDKIAESISPQKLYGVPVGLMFFEGSPRLLAAGLTIPHLREGDPLRIAVEAYPGVLARQLIRRRSYKSDTRKKQTDDQAEARLDLINSLRQEAPKRYGFSIEAPNSLCADPGGDDLDALLCAVQAAWAWQQRDNRFGAPESIDPLEGWISDPQLADNLYHFPA
ncbi:DUF429 domain-containing protein [Paramagnetospirillum magnetotacticum]|uniref:DUF429 domain-containing protein n=1 Tax=Paramagnetospirillum magnetotacticum TaxID=188 RepID=UPI0005970328|nr:DUF429 domain-containing protein [Paramagnetospirillum magnetotacticum]